MGCRPRRRHLDKVEADQPEARCRCGGSKVGFWPVVEVYPAAHRPGQPAWQLGAAESMPDSSKSRVSKRVVPGVQVPPFPLSKRNRIVCPAAAEIRMRIRPLENVGAAPANLGSLGAVWKRGGSATRSRRARNQHSDVDAVLHARQLIPDELRALPCC